MLKEQQLKKIKAKQKRLQGILGLTEFADEANEIEYEEDEGMYKKRLKVLFCFDVMPFLFVCLKLFCKIFSSKEINFSGCLSKRVKNTYSVHLQICKSWHIHVGSFKKWMLICIQLCRDG